MFEQVHIFIPVPEELDYECDYFGTCDCGCGKELYKGMTIYKTDAGKRIYCECLPEYIKSGVQTLH